MVNFFPCTTLRDLLAIVCLLLTSACAPADDTAEQQGYVVGSSPRPTKHFVLSLDECIGQHTFELLLGAALWDEVGLTFELGAGGIPVRCSDPPEIESLGATWPGRQVLIERLFVQATSPNYLVSCLAHELGHLAGLQHVESKAALMYALAEGTIALTDEDRAEALRASFYW